MIQSISQNVLSNALAAFQVLWVIRKAKREAISNLCRDSLLKKGI
jgi:hypothetical protein